MERIYLTEGDTSGQTWGKIKIHLEQRLAHLRTQLEADINELQSTRLRGQIFEVKLFLDMGADRPIVDE